MESNNRNNEYDDEIDLIELFKKIWKWKWLIIGLTITVTIVTFFYVKSRPDTYTVSANIVIGKIANFSIEDPLSVGNYIKRMSMRDNQSEFDEVKFDFNKKNDILTVSSKTESGEDSFKIIDKTFSLILKRHDDLYNEAVLKINKSIVSSKNGGVIHPSYVLRSYNFKSYILNKINKPEKADSKKMKLKIAVAFITSIFISVFVVFFLDFLFTYKKKLDNK